MVERPIVSDRDRLLIERWLAMMERDSRLYNVDNHHQCFRGEPNQIVKPFPLIAPNFYGCRHCGQYHICYLQHRECAGLVDPLSNLLTCQYSGQSIPGTNRVAPIGTHEERVTFYDRPTTVEQYLKSDQKKTRFRFRPRRKMMYTNIRMPTSRALEEGPETSKKKKKKAAHKEKPHPMMCTTTTKKKRPRYEQSESSSCEESNQDDDDMPEPASLPQDGSSEELEEMDEEMRSEDERDIRDYYTEESELRWDDTGQKHERPLHSNTLFWNAYYSFLLPIVSEGGGGGGGGGGDAQMEVAKPTFNHALLSGEIREQIRVTTAQLVQEMLALQIATRKGLELTNGRRTSIVGPLVAHYSEIVERILTLVYQAPEMAVLVEQKMAHAEKYSQSLTTARTTVREIKLNKIEADDANLVACTLTIPPALACEAVMLELLLHPFYDEDELGIQMEVWHSDAWLNALAGEGVIDQMFGGSATRRAKHKKRQKLGDGERIYERGRVENVAANMLRCLSHYRGHPHWLKEVILHAV
jgi:hypothetical protein